MKLESFFDKANREGTNIPGPKVLYHYTSWAAAESILRSQRSRATAHDCNNDEAEFASADATIIEAVQGAIAQAQAPVTRRVLRLFFADLQGFKNRRSPPSLPRLLLESA